MLCPCGSGNEFDRCCGPFLDGKRKPRTAETLMRSRYTAYTQNNIEYLATTHAPETRSLFDLSAASRWAARAKWLGLRVLSTDKGQSEDDEGAVEFVATYEQNGETIAHHEFSRFRRIEDGEWRFVAGDARTLQGDEGRRLRPSPREAPPTVAPGAPKVGRNDPCPCGSGVKYKKCCGA